MIFSTCVGHLGWHELEHIKNEWWQTKFPRFTFKFWDCKEKFADPGYPQLRLRLFARFAVISTFCCMSKFLRQKANSKNKNCFREVTLYLMDSPWKIFWYKKNSKFSTFYFLNLSPACWSFEPRGGQGKKRDDQNFFAGVF